MENYYNLTFNVDMSTLPSFNPETENVYVKGLFGDSVIMNSTDNINFSAKVNVVAGTYNYKYFTTSMLETNERAITVIDENIVTDDKFIPVGIEISKAKLIELYPNPFNKNLIIDNLGNTTQIIIRNLLGQVVMTVPITNSTMEINTDNLEKGIYLITIQDNNGNTQTEKIVKQ